jgi:hypothetical protein
VYLSQGSGSTGTFLHHPVSALTCVQRVLTQGEVSLVLGRAVSSASRFDQFASGSCIRSATQDIPNTTPRGVLPHSQGPTPVHILRQANSEHGLLWNFSKIRLMISCCLCFDLPSNLFLSDFLAQPCIDFPFFPYMLHAHLISWCSSLSPFALSALFAQNPHCVLLMMSETGYHTHTKQKKN